MELLTSFNKKHPTRIIENIFCYLTVDHGISNTLKCQVIENVYAWLHVLYYQTHYFILVTLTSYAVKPLTCDCIHDFNNMTSCLFTLTYHPCKPILTNLMSSFILFRTHLQSFFYQKLASLLSPSSTLTFQAILSFIPHLSSNQAWVPTYQKI